MKIFIFITSIIIYLVNFSFYSQQDVTEITEGSEAEICGKTVRVDGFWINNYDAVADVSIITAKMSKPITGGYSKEDTMDITNECRRYIVSVKKYGMQQKGIVSISSVPDVLYSHKHKNEFTMKQNEKYVFGYEEWKAAEILQDSALIKVIGEDISDYEFYLKKNDVVWFGEYAFYVSAFNPADGKIEMKMVRDYSYINFPVIPGEKINAPINIPSPDEELILRKMKLYPKMKIDEEEYRNTPVKYWVLRIYYYPRGIASPVIKINRNGKDMMVEYSGYKSFDTEEEAMEFVKINNIKDTKLDEDGK